MLDNKVLQMTPGEVLTDVPIQEMIARLGNGIAEAQLRLDQTAVRVATLLSGARIDMIDAQGKQTSKSLLELGFTPTFYHFTEAEIEVKMTMSMKVEEDFGLGVSLNVGNDAGSVAAANSAAQGSQGNASAAGSKPAAGAGGGAQGGQSNPPAAGAQPAPAAGGVAQGGQGNPPAAAAQPAAAAGGGAQGGQSNPPAAGAQSAAAAGGSGQGGQSGDTSNKRAVMFGAAINVEYHRKYEFDVSGSSLVRTKMISVPAPTTFLDMLKEQARIGGKITASDAAAGTSSPAPAPTPGASG